MAEKMRVVARVIADDFDECSDCGEHVRVKTPGVLSTIKLSCACQKASFKDYVDSVYMMGIRDGVQQGIEKGAEESKMMTVDSFDKIVQMFVARILPELDETEVLHRMADIADQISEELEGTNSTLN